MGLFEGVNKMSILTKEQVKDVIELYDIKTAEDAHDAVKDLMKDVLQRTLDAELSNTLGYDKYDTGNKKTANSRNGSYKKGVRSSLGSMSLNIPRDRDGEHVPLIVKKGQTDVSSIDERIISMYGYGMSTRDINQHMQEIYGIDVSAEFVSKVTDKILPRIREWQGRALQPLYPIVYMDAIFLSIREDGHVVKKAVYIAIGIDSEGMKDVLGIWIGGNESAKYWLGVLTDLKNRGVQDILICSIDGLKGFEQAIGTVFPQAEIQRCIVHQIRYSCKFVNYKDRKLFCKDMKRIYTAATEEGGLEQLKRFEETWGKKYGYAVRSWENNWAVLSTFFKYPEEIRKLIYTTNPIESVNSSIRKVARPKRIFPTNDSALKIVFLALQGRISKWTMRVRSWNTIIGQLSIHFGDRMEIPV
jgi:putative transposase